MVMIDGKRKLGDAAGFAQEAIDVLRIRADVARTRNLDGDDAVEFGVAGLEDGAERAVAERAEHLELADAFVAWARPRWRSRSWRAGSWSRSRRR